VSKDEYGWRKEMNATWERRCAWKKSCVGE
jgi:hypothetical protein